MLRPYDGRGFCGTDWCMEYVDVGGMQIAYKRVRLRPAARHAARCAER